MNRISLGNRLSAEILLISSPKSTYLIWAHDDPDSMGTVKWSPRFRQYVFTPDAGTTYSAEELTALAALCQRAARVETEHQAEEAEYQAAQAARAEAHRLCRGEKEA